jgi:hypothetical protein
MNGGAAPQGASISPQDIIDIQQGRSFFIFGDGFCIEISFQTPRFIPLDFSSKSLPLMIHDLQATYSARYLLKSSAFFICTIERAIA